MANVCSCDSVLGNTGVSKCPAIPGIARKLILVPYYDASGNVNEIDATSLSAPEYGASTGTGFNAAFFALLVNQADKYNRWYPLPNMKNVENTRETPVYETFEDGTQEKIRDGVGSFVAVITNMSPTFLAQIEKAACTAIGAYIVDHKNSIIGIANGNKLQPIKIDEKTWAPQYVHATDAIVPKVQLNFQWDLSVMDSALSMISAENISYTLTNLVGLLDIKAVSLVADSATQLTVKVSTLYGSVGDQDLVKGLILSEVKVYNQTTSTQITPSAIAEVADGTYEITIAAQTAADVLHVRVTKNGFDDTILRTTTVAAL